MQLREELSSALCVSDLDTFTHHSPIREEMGKTTHFFPLHFWRELKALGCNKHPA